MTMTEMPASAEPIISCLEGEAYFLTHEGHMFLRNRIAELPSINSLADPLRLTQTLEDIRTTAMGLSLMGFCATCNFSSECQITAAAQGVLRPEEMTLPLLPLLDGEAA